MVSTSSYLKVKFIFRLCALFSSAPLYYSIFNHGQCLVRRTYLLSLGPSRYVKIDGNRAW